MRIQSSLEVLNNAVYVKSGVLPVGSSPMERAPRTPRRELPLVPILPYPAQYGSDSRSMSLNSNFTSNTVATLAAKALCSLSSLPLSLRVAMNFPNAVLSSLLVETFCQLGSY